MKYNQAGMFMWQVWLVDKCVRDIQVCVGGSIRGTEGRQMCGSGRRVAGRQM